MGLGWLLERARLMVNGLILAVAVLLNTTVVQADWIDDFPGAQSIGAGQLKWFGFAVYEARLWSRETRPTLDQPFALEVTFLRKLKRETLVETSLDEIRRLGGEGLDPRRLARWALEMRRAFVDVTPGQHIAGLYLPGRGCRFYVVGQLSREVADPEFARAFFAIWLDPRTRAPQTTPPAAWPSGRRLTHGPISTGQTTKQSL